MRQPDVRHAMAAREWGLRRIRRLTWGIAGAGAVCSAVLAFGFGSHAHLSQVSRPPGVPTGSENQGGGQQVPGDGQLQPPQTNPLPAQGPGQVVSGGS